MKSIYGNNFITLYHDVLQLVSDYNSTNMEQDTDARNQKKNL